MTGEPEVVRELYGQHRDRIWRDGQGDIWFASSTVPGKWECRRPGNGRPASGMVLPERQFGPYTDVTHISPYKLGIL